MIDKFVLYMRQLGKSQNTMETYTRNVRQYFEWCEFSFGNVPPQLYRANVLEYISYMRNLEGYSPKSVNNHLSTLRCLNEFLIAEGIQTEMVIQKVALSFCPEYDTSLRYYITWGSLILGVDVLSGFSGNPVFMRVRRN